MNAVIKQTGDRLQRAQESYRVARAELWAALAADSSALIPADLPPEIAAIIHIVAADAGLTEASLLGQARPNHIAQPRQVAMMLTRALTKHSLETIGVAFGGRDHGTVIHALKAVQSRREQEPRFPARLESLRRSCLKAIANLKAPAAA